MANSINKNYLAISSLTFGRELLKNYNKNKKIQGKLSSIKGSIIYQDSNWVIMHGNYYT